jgi:hypothetical protein
MANQFLTGLVGKITSRLRDATKDRPSPDDMLTDLISGEVDLAQAFGPGEMYIREIFVRGLDRPEFRTRLIDAASPDDAGYLSDVYDVIDMWRTERQSRYEFARSRILGNPVDEIERWATTRVNDVINAFSIIGSDTLSEDLSVKMAVRLGSPNKALGDDDLLIVATTLTSFLYSLAIMTGSLVKTNGERNILKAAIPKDRKEKLVTAMKSLEGSVSKLKQQIDEITQ